MVYPALFSRRLTEHRSGSGAGLYVAEPVTITSRDYHFVYANLGRAGLGNLLFPWARAIITAQELDILMLPPKWFKVRIGPLVRGDVDRRRYHRLFVPPSFCDAARREVILRRATLWSESGRLIRKGGGTSVLVTAGVQPYFEPLLAWRTLILRRLLESARREMLAHNLSSEPYFAFHIRLGDFVRPDKSVGRSSIRLHVPMLGQAQRSGHTTVNTSTPISWFVAAANQIRAEGCNHRIIVCSDGTDKDLRPFTRLHGVSVKQGGNALDDLMTLANATVVIGSGSSFSAWGAFLADSPLFVAAGLNHFLPDEFPVREVESWDSSVARALLRHDLYARSMLSE